MTLKAAYTVSIYYIHMKRDTVIFPPSGTGNCTKANKRKSSVGLIHSHAELGQETLYLLIVQEVGLKPQPLPFIELSDQPGRTHLPLSMYSHGHSSLHTHTHARADPVHGGVSVACTVMWALLIKGFDCHADPSLSLFVFICLSFPFISFLLAVSPPNILLPLSTWSFGSNAIISLPLTFSLTHMGVT